MIMILGHRERGKVNMLYQANVDKNLIFHKLIPLGKLSTLTEEGCEISTWLIIYSYQYEEKIMIYETTWDLASMDEDSLYVYLRTEINPYNDVRPFHKVTENGFGKSTKLDQWCDGIYFDSILLLGTHPHECHEIIESCVWLVLYSYNGEDRIFINYMAENPFDFGLRKMLAFIDPDYDVIPLPGIKSVLF